jgi:hypothetical protein
MAAVAVTLAAAFVVLGFLAARSCARIPVASQPPLAPGIPVALQILHLASIAIGFASLMWGFWGAIGSATGACLMSLTVVVVAGRASLESHLVFARSPFLVECLLFGTLGWMCLQFLEREQVEETADWRQLERLEEEFLELAIQFGKREELLRVLEKKQERLRHLDALGARMRSEASAPEGYTQICLAEVVQGVGKGEAEVVLYGDGAAVVRHPRGGTPVAVDEGRDEIDRWLEEHRTALLVNNLTHDVRFTPGFGRSRQIVSVVAVPLVFEGHLRGTLRLSSTTPQAFTHEDLRFASEAAGILLPLIFQSA